MNNEQLVARIMAGENEAENMLQLWKQNKGFIAMIARRYSAGAEMEDLEQEGYIALCEAARHYESDRGASFISYAAFWIKRRMRICADNNRTVRLSFNAGDEVRQYQKIMRNTGRRTAVIHQAGSCVASYTSAGKNSTRSGKQLRWAIYGALTSLCREWMAISASGIQWHLVRIWKRTRSERSTRNG